VSFYKYVLNDVTISSVNSDQQEDEISTLWFFHLCITHSIRESALRQQKCLISYELGCGTVDQRYDTIEINVSSKA